MSTAVTIIIAVLVFGFLIFIHEFGHFITARIFHVTINEFSIGMGPRLVYYDSKKSGIRYSLAMLPIGGFVSMAGEDAMADEAKRKEAEAKGEEYIPVADDPNTFDKKPAWQRFIITIAGATVNITAGFLAMLILTAFINIGGTTVGQFVPQEESGYTVSTQDSGLQLNDEIIRVEGKRVRVSDELVYEVMRRGVEPVDLTVIRDGEEIVLSDVVFPTATESGQNIGLTDFYVYAEEKDLGTVLRYSWAKSILIVRMCWESVYDLIRGRFTVEAVSGPVGITSAIGTAASAGASSLVYMIVLISINLGVMNLLPLPALDGGRALTTLVEMVTKKRLPAKVESIINTAGLVVLLALSFVIMIKDVIGLL